MSAGSENHTRRGKLDGERPRRPVRRGSAGNSSFVLWLPNAFAQSHTASIDPVGVKVSPLSERGDDDAARTEINHSGLSPEAWRASAQACNLRPASPYYLDDARSSVDFFVDRQRYLKTIAVGVAGKVRVEGQRGGPNDDDDNGEPLHATRSGRKRPSAKSSTPDTDKNFISFFDDLIRGIDPERKWSRAAAANES